MKETTPENTTEPRNTSSPLITSRLSNFFDKWWAKYVVMVFWLIPALLIVAILSQFLTNLLVGPNASDGTKLGSIADYIFMVAFGWPILAMVASTLTIHGIRLIKKGNLAFGLLVLFLLSIPFIWVYGFLILALTSK